MLSGRGQLHLGAIVLSVEHMEDLQAAVCALGGPVEDAIAIHTREILRDGGIIPGYGHAMLRGEDTRLRLSLRLMHTQVIPSLDQQLAAATDEDDRSAIQRKRETLDIITKAMAVIPEVLKEEVPKMKHPAPNLDSLTGSLFWAMGFDEDFALLTVLGGRAMGCGAVYVWDRGV